MTLVHGTCVEIDGAGVLLRGPSGAGKSDLALRLIDEGARLVSDDQVELIARSGEIMTLAPPAIAGLIEVRGIGPLPAPAADMAPLALVIDLSPEPVERVPEPASAELLGLRVPAITLNPFHPSAAARVRLALRCARTGTLPA